MLYHELIDNPVLLKSAQFCTKVSSFLHLMYCIALGKLKLGKNLFPSVSVKTIQKALGKEVDFHLKSKEDISLDENDVM